MGFFRRRANHLPFHITDLEDYLANFQAGNLASATKKAFRILDRCSNGPLEGGGVVEKENPIDEATNNKLEMIEEKLKSLVNHNELLLGKVEAEEKDSGMFDDDSSGEEHKGKGKKKTKEPAKLKTPGEAGVTVSNEPDVEAIPWVLFLELAYMIIKAIQEYRQKNKPAPAPV